MTDKVIHINYRVALSLFELMMEIPFEYRDTRWEDTVEVLRAAINKVGADHE